MAPGMPISMTAMISGSASQVGPTSLISQETRRRPVRPPENHQRGNEMRRITIWRLTTTWLLILCFALAGCTGMEAQQTQQTKTTEELLSAAGFKQIFPTTPKLKDRLQALPQKQIFMASRGPKLFYVYADAAGCGCIYAGNQQQYQAYQQLAARYKMAAMQVAAAEMNEAAAMDWGEAGPWY